MKIIDVWAQITTERMAKRPWLETLMRWTARSGEHILSSPKRTLAPMDEGGVGIAFLSAWHVANRKVVNPHLCAAVGIAEADG